MEVVNYSEFRKELKGNLDKASNDGEIIIISRSQDKNVVLISMHEYNSMMETIHLMSSEKNRERLSHALLEMEEGKFLKNGIIED